jgi:flagellar hook-associated protein 2
VDGRTYYSNTNVVSSAIDGVKINLLSEGTSTLTIAPDTAATTSAVQGLVDAFNSLADKLDTLTANPVGGTPGALRSEFGVRDITLTFRNLITSSMTSSGALHSLADIGVTTGAVGSSKGTTNRLQLDTDKLASALETNPSSVASLLSAGLTSLSTAATGWTKVGGSIDSVETSITSQLKDLDNREVQVNERVALRQTALEAKFAAMEATLAKLQTTTNSLTQTISQQNKSSG